MGQVLVRNLDEDVIDAIRLRAEARGVSLEQELRDIITAAAPLTPAERAALIDRFHAKFDEPVDLDLTALIREGRDSR